MRGRQEPGWDRVRGEHPLLLVLVPDMPTDDTDLPEAPAGVHSSEEAVLDLGPLTPPYTITVRFSPDSPLVEVRHPGLSIPLTQYILDMATETLSETDPEPEGDDD
jgi:hypothetical protein